MKMEADAKEIEKRTKVREKKVRMMKEKKKK